MLYSNDMTNVKKFVRKATTEEFRKQFILVTESNRHYVYGGAKRGYASQREAINAAVSMGVDEEDIRFMDQLSGYYRISTARFLPGINNEWVDIVILETNSRLADQNLFKVRSWYSMVRIYKDSKFKLYDISISGDGEISIGLKPSGQNIDGVTSDTDGLRPKKEIPAGVIQSINDIDYKHQLSMNVCNNPRRYFSDQTKKILKDVFCDIPDEDLSNYKSFRDFIKSGRGQSSNKAAETKKSLLENVFTPILQTVERPELEFNKVDLAKAMQLGYTRISRYGSTKDASIHRVGDWILFSSSGDWRVFYNVKTNKRYYVNYYEQGAPYYHRERANIGVFRTEDVIHELNNYRRSYSRCSAEAYMPNSYKSVSVRYENTEYYQAPRCYDENNNPISPLELFKDTPVVDFLKSKVDMPYMSFSHYKDKAVQICTYKDIVALNRCPGLALLFLYMRKDHKLIAEQLFKLGLNGLLIQLLINPNSFGEKSKVDSLSSWSRNDVFCAINAKETNLKSILGVNMEKIKMYDAILFDDYNTNMQSSTKVPSIYLLKSILGDSFNSVDNTTFTGLIEYCKDSGLRVSECSELKDLGILNRTPKDLLRILNKIGSIGTYRDYLRIRNRYLGYFEADQRKDLSRIYKELPDKAKKFKYLRPKTEGWYSHRVVMPAEQLQDYTKKYKNAVPVYNNDGSVMGVHLDMSESEHIRFLHDELTDFVNAHAKELRDEGFKSAAKRLEKYEYTGKHLSIVAPKESTDLAMEGGTLHHCVAGFIDPVIQNTENVLFIRRNDMLDTPYFTIAIDNGGNIEQIHGYRNCNLSEDDQISAWNASQLDSYNGTFDLVAFLREWAKHKSGLVKESTIRNNYGVLGAHR